MSGNGNVPPSAPWQAPNNISSPFGIPGIFPNYALLTLPPELTELIRKCMDIGGKIKYNRIQKVANGVSEDSIFFESDIPLTNKKPSDDSNTFESVS